MSLYGDEPTTNKNVSGPVFAPAKMNWVSRRMYNTLKRANLYVLYGLILGVCGLLDTLCPQTPSGANSD